MADQHTGLTGRAAAQAKRRAIANGGKAGGPSAAPAPAGAGRRAATPAPSTTTARAPDLAPVSRVSQSLPGGVFRTLRVAEGRQRSLARRQALTRGQIGATAAARPARLRPRPERRVSSRPTAVDSAAASSTLVQTEQRQVATSERSSRLSRSRTAQALIRAQSRGRLASMARRTALADRGKVGIESVSGRSSAAATTQLLRNAGASSREIAKRVREERCEHGKCADAGPRPTGRLRPARPGVPAKVGLSATATGQTITGTLVGRSPKTTGDEVGACRQITGTEYLGAEIFQEFCGVKPNPAPNRQSEAVVTVGGQTVTGDQVGRSVKVTGDEAGAGRVLTGTPYTAPGPEGAPSKVGQTQTLSGRQVTGTLVGRIPSITGVEPGSCQRVTGTEYLGFEHFASFCKTRPEPKGDLKVGVDATWRGQTVTGTLVGGSARVTGNEPGRCEVVTGTGYLGPKEVAAECSPDTIQAVSERLPAAWSTPGHAISGIQPGVGGVMTGDQKGACQPITGTPYVGGDDFFAACGESLAATPGSDDFPQPLNGGQWIGFSITTPARAAQEQRVRRAVTGTRYDEDQGRITGPFNLGGDRVTGTESFRAKRSEQRTMPVAAEEKSAPPEPARPRITGEGMDAGPRITGDDWARNERVTGTEGLSAHSRNPSMRGGSMTAFAGARLFRNAQERERTWGARVTGSTGGTERGALVTLSGGARG
ncbi:carboxysome shell protein [Caldichromatium japonicum]|uniref:Carboxysome shell protein n=1 Tax=Caldichromatium japonicum TaxID=2699430 RepID=A0A6G7VGI2_9GAMM|nr:CsoS2 family carboxysome shell protein [Caldichromatium japonicum]QIK38975.1 carboxysome shell protein [Caldichromatium japonicum]